MIHELKTWPRFFEAVKTGRKTFEVRRDDRGFMPEDTLKLREWIPPLKNPGGVYKCTCWDDPSEPTCFFCESEGAQLSGRTAVGARYTGRELLAEIGYIFRDEEVPSPFGPGYPRPLGDDDTCVLSLLNVRGVSA